MDLGSFVREKRRALNLSQEQLADRASVGLNFVYQLEKNKPSVQLDCTRRVLAALGFELAVAPLPEAYIAPSTDNRAGATRASAHKPTPRLPWD